MASVELRDAINRGWVPGPRLQVVGPHLNPGHSVYPAPSTPGEFEHQNPMWQTIINSNSPWLMRQNVREHARYGVDGGKDVHHRRFSQDQDIRSIPESSGQTAR